MLIAMLSISFTDLLGQCDTNDFPISGYSGINTFNSIPKKMFDIHGRVGYTDECKDVTLRLSYHEYYDGFLTLLTDYTQPLPWYTSVPSKSFGDVVLVANRMNAEYHGGNIILQTRDSSRSIILATRSLIAPSSTYTWYEDVERQKIYPTGRIDFNIGNWNYGLGKISFFNHNGDPTIKFYRPTGNVPTVNGESFPFWIKSTGYYNPAYCYGCYGTLMDFMSGQSNTIGFETTQSLMTLRLETSGNPHNIGYIGVNNTFPIAGMQVTNRNVLFEGDSGGVPVTGAGTRFMWIPEKAAIRAGNVTSTRWDVIGNYSAAFGRNNKATAVYSTSSGHLNEATGEASTAFGESNIVSGDWSTSSGNSNTASGEAATAFGYNNKSSGNYTSTSGNTNVGSGIATTAFGNNNSSLGDYSTSSGNSNTASGVAASVFGYNCISTGNYSTSSGNSNTTSGVAATAFGYNCNASGTYTTASGESNIASGLASTAFGKNNYSNANYTTTSGNSNTASGIASVAMGNNNKSSGLYSTSSGNSNIASGESSFAVGYNCIASGTYSTATGNSNTASGLNSVALGWKNIASGVEAVAIGESNTCTQDESIAIGEDNLVIGEDATAIGDGNYVTGTDGVAIGASDSVKANCAFTFGHQLTAGAQFSTAMGNYASTDTMTGSFIIGDMNGETLNQGRVYSTNVNQMTMKFTGIRNDISSTNITYRLITGQSSNGPVLNEAILSADSFGWILPSDRNLKKNIKLVDINKTLYNLRQVPINTWEWKNDSVYQGNKVVWDSLSYLWLGPIAQDFYKQFPIGFPDSSKLCTSVMEGAMFASIQALADISDTLKAVDSVNQENIDTLKNNIGLVNKKIDSLSNNISKMKTESDSLKNIISDIKTFNDSLLKDNLEIKLRLSVLEGKVNELANLIGANIDCYSDILLEQNVPNPFNETTVINYYVPSRYPNAQFVLADADGQREIETYSITFDYPAQIIISTQNLDNGIYLYGIRYNGRIVKSKKMIVIK
ncbi:MAG: hypothetical protein HW421_3474 [Ignavibacteria bacterium]|nr:hypothetical protein [Ignavibacteria bacterium]